MDSMRQGVGLIVGAGIPKGKRSTIYVECGCCGMLHRSDFRGDCRENSERFKYEPEDSTGIVYLEDEHST